MVHIYTRGDEPVPQYRLVKFLGKGGFGEVWKVTTPGGVEAALKIINLDGNQGLKEFRAIRLVKKIRHPNLVPITAFWLKDEEGNLVEDSVADNTSSAIAGLRPVELLVAMGLGDKNLYDYLKECREQGLEGIPVEALLDYIEGSARAIDFLNSPRHDLGQGPVAIQHCDIKPQNIMLVADSAQVCDFGLARVLGDTRTTAATMSAAYVAPEFISESKPSKWTDQYSLAISYMEMRTGQLPFVADTPWAILNSKLQGKLDLSRLPPAEQPVIAKATALNPTDRYATCLDMVRALRMAIGDRGSGPSIPTVSLIDPERGTLILQPGVEIVPGYKLVQKLGAGSYGEVWEATAPGGKHVALKIIQRLEAVEGKQEFKALELIKGVEHTHLMDLHAYWLLDKEGHVIPDEVRNSPRCPPASSLVIDCKLAAKNLAQRLQECLRDTGQAIPLEELLRYMRQAAQAIDYLNAPQHTLGGRQVSIQHRDIKPENILLAGDTVKVGDFGLAKVVEGTSAVIHGDSTGLTLYYAAPEMFEGKVTSWTDQYSLAVTYYQLRTGAVPFARNARQDEIIRAHLEGRLDLSGLPDAERAVIARATALEAEERFPSCTAMVMGLYDICAVDPADPGSVLFPSPTQQPGGGTRSSDPRFRPLTARDPRGSGKTAPGGGGAITAAPAHTQPYTKSLQQDPSIHDTGKLADQETKDQPEPRRPRRPPLSPAERERRKRRTIKITLIVALAATVLTGAGVGGWAIKRSMAAGALEKDVSSLIDSGEFAKAYDTINDSDVTEAKKTELFTNVANAAEKSLRADRDTQKYDEAIEKVKALGEHFKDFPKLAELVKQVQRERAASVRITSAVDAGEAAIEDPKKPLEHFDRAIKDAEIKHFPMLYARALLGHARASARQSMWSDVDKNLKQVASLGQKLTLEQQVQVATLQVLLDFFRTDGPAADFGVVLDSLVKLKELDATGLLAKAKWEPDQITNKVTPSVLKKMRALLAADETPKTALPLAKRILVCDPKDPETLAQVKSLEAWTLAQDPAQRGEAFAAVKRLLDGPTPVRALPLAEALANLADADTSLLNDAVTTLAGVLPKLPDGPRKDQLDQRHKAAMRQMAGNQFVTVLAKTRISLKAGAYADSRKALLEAEAAARGPAQRLDVEYWKALVFAEDTQSTDAELLEAVQLFKKLVTEKGITEKTSQLVQLCDTFVTLAAKDKLSQCFGSSDLVMLGEVLKKIPDSEKDKKVLISRLEKVRAGSVYAVFRGYLSELETAFRKPDFKRCRDILLKADPAAPNEEGTNQVKFWRARIYAKDAASTAAEHKIALQLFGELLGETSPPQPVELGQDLADFAEKHPLYVSQVKAILAKAATNPWLSTGDQGKILERYKNIVAREVELRIRQVPENVEERRKYFTDLLADCRQQTTPTSNQWLKAGLAESLIEVSGAKVSPADWQLADKTIKSVVGPNFTPYVHYVRGLVARNAKPVARLETAAEEMVMAFKDPDPQELRGHRTQEALAILQQAAALPQARLDDDLNTPLQLPSDAEAVNRLYRWLTKTRELATLTKKPFSWDMQVNLALAAGLKKDAEADKVARTLIPEVLKDTKTQERKLLVYALHLLAAQVAAREDTPQGRQTALQNFAAILEAMKKNKDQEPNFRDLYQWVLTPGLDLASKLAVSANSDAALQRQVARLHAARGGLILANKYEDWPFEPKEGSRKDREVNRVQEALKAYQEAIRLDTASAEYVVGRGRARSQLPKPDLKAIEEDGQLAISLDKQLPGGYGLYGFALHHRAIQVLAGEPDRFKLEKDAEENYLRAIKLCADAEEYKGELATDATNLSITYVVLANAVNGRDRKKEYLDKAVQFGTQAVALNQRYPHVAYEALGNALEDLGSPPIGERGKFEEAIEAFTNAHNAQQNEARPLCARGRCLYKTVYYGKQVKDLLKEAISDLDQALKRDPNLHEAQYHLGLVYLFQKSYDLSDDCFQQAVALAQQRGDSEWQTYLLNWAEKTSVEAENLLTDTTKTNDAVGTGRREKVRVLARQLLKQNPGDALRLLGYSYEYGPDIDLREAVKHYDQGLKMDQTPKAQVLLRVMKSELYLKPVHQPLLKQFPSLLPGDQEITEFQPAVQSVLKKLPNLSPRDLVMLEDVKRAVKLAHGNASVPDWVHAEARAAAALIRHSKLASPGKDAFRADAMTDLREAIKLAPDHPYGWLWRAILATNLRIYIANETNLALKEEMWREGERILGEAKEAAPTVERRQQLAQMWGEFKDRK